MKKHWISIGILAICAVTAVIVISLMSSDKTKIIHLPGGIVLEMQSTPSGLWFGKYEVTQAQWEAVMGNNPTFSKGTDNPVGNVSYFDCLHFLKKLNALPAAKKSGLTFRLPTGEEWKAACRAGATGDYCKLADGTEITGGTLGEVAWFDENSGEEMHPVGQKKPNAFGLYDMHGNVEEWTADAIREDRVFGEEDVVCGGSYVDSARFCKASFQGSIPPSHSHDNIGFRICAFGGVGEASTRVARDAPPDAEAICASMIQIPGKSYKMGKYEVTQAQWAAVMRVEMGFRRVPSDGSYFYGDDYPVVDVSWNDCQFFLEILNASPAAKKSGMVFRLPTEAEWEYACRAGAMGEYCKLADGTEITEKTLDEVAWFFANSSGRSHPVGQKKPNAFGLYDMHGNVSEWTDTADGEFRVIRGGDRKRWASDCSSAIRMREWPDFQNFDLGFRLCAETASK